MKKLLVLALVLSMATMASAALQISVNGNRNPGVIELLPSDTLILDIWTNAAIAPAVGEGYFAIGTVSQLGTNAGGVSLFPLDGGIAIYDDAVANGIVMAAGENGVWGSVLLSVLSGIAADTTIFDGIIFHCEGPGDVQVNLYFSPDGSVFDIVDSVVIHQIPEPFTMGLLGLGGLFLRRRSK